MRFQQRRALGGPDGPHACCSFKHKRCHDAGAHPRQTQVREDANESAPHSEHTLRASGSDCTQYHHDPRIPDDPTTPMVVTRATTCAASTAALAEAPPTLCANGSWCASERTGGSRTARGEYVGKATETTAATGGSGSALHSGQVAALETRSHLWMQPGWNS